MALATHIWHSEGGVHSVQWTGNSVQVEGVMCGLESIFNQTGRWCIQQACWGFKDPCLLLGEASVKEHFSLFTLYVIHPEYRSQLSASRVGPAFAFPTTSEVMGYCEPKSQTHMSESFFSQTF